MSRSSCDATTHQPRKCGAKTQNRFPQKQFMSGGNAILSFQICGMLSDRTIAMDERFCIFYRDQTQTKRGLKLSMAFESVDLAIVHAYELAKKGAAPIQVRGDQGTVIEEYKLSSILDNIDKFILNY